MKNKSNQIISQSCSTAAVHLEVAKLLFLLGVQLSKSKYN